MENEYQIKPVHGDKKRYLDLLLTGDESEKMIDRYLPRADMYVMYISGIAAGVCAVTRESDTLVEIRNIAVRAEYRRMGLGHELLRFVEEHYSSCDLCLGTGETPSTLHFYNTAGYTYSHRIKNFFIDNYDHAIIEEGVRLTDMIYLKKARRHKNM